MQKLKLWVPVASAVLAGGREIQKKRKGTGVFMGPCALHMFQLDAGLLFIVFNEN